MKKYAVRSIHGFTLIELLIVIALLGALAVGLLATIDPFEQLKKGRDTSLRNTVSEFYNANLRYYSIKGNFPWNTGGTGAQAQQALTSAVMSSAIDELVSTGELKQRFSQLAGGTQTLGRVFVTSPAADTVSVCFAPESKSFQEDVNTQYSGDGATAGGCYSQSPGTSGSSCFFCVQ